MFTSILWVEVCNFTHQGCWPAVLVCVCACLVGIRVILNQNEFGVGDGGKCLKSQHSESGGRMIRISRSPSTKYFEASLDSMKPNNRVAEGKRIWKCLFSILVNCLDDVS